MSTPWDYSTTPPEGINYGTLDAPTAAAPVSANPPAMSVTAPGQTAVAALSLAAPVIAAVAPLSTTAPASTATADLSTAAPLHSDPAALSAVAPSSTVPAALSAAAPGAAAPAGMTNSPAQTLNPDGTTQTGLPSMPSAFTPAFIELTGGGASLNTLTANAADATAGKILQGTVGGQLKSYQVQDGTDAQDLPGIVHPANFDPVANPVIFVEL